MVSIMTEAGGRARLCCVYNDCTGVESVGTLASLCHGTWQLLPGLSTSWTQYTQTNILPLSSQKYFILVYKDSSKLENEWEKDLWIICVSVHCLCPCSDEWQELCLAVHCFSVVAGQGASRLREPWATVPHSSWYWPAYLYTSVITTLHRGHSPYRSAPYLQPSHRQSLRSY